MRPAGYVISAHVAHGAIWDPGRNESKETIDFITGGLLQQWAEKIRLHVFPPLIRPWLCRLPVVNMAWCVLICCERGLFWVVVLMNVVCFELVCHWTGVLRTRSVMNWSAMNVVCFQMWSVMNWSVTNVVCYEQVCFEREPCLLCRGVLREQFPRRRITDRGAEKSQQCLCGIPSRNDGLTQASQHVQQNNEKLRNANS